jgi:hypothetical protein
VRFFKSTAITVIALFAIFIITFFIISYSARIYVINNLAKDQLNLYQVKVNCLDISLASNMAIIVDRLCLQSPKADIEIADMVVQWQFFPKFKVTSVDIKQADIKGTEHLFFNISPISKKAQHRNNNQNFSQLLSTALQPHIKQIEQFKLPININVTELSYLPFMIKNERKKSPLIQQQMPYVASLSAVDNQWSFSLKNAEKIAFIKAELNRIKHQSTVSFSITLSSKLNLLKTFINTHQLPITAELQNIVNTNEISGRMDTVIKYQANSISMHNEIANLAITSDNGIGSSGAYKLEAALNIESQLHLMAGKTANTTKSEKSNPVDANIALTFIGNNSVSLAYSQPHFFSLLEKSQVSPAIISILTDNPLAQITLKPKGNATLILNNKQLNFSGIEFSASGNKRVHHISLDNIALDFANNSKESHTENNTKGTSGNSAITAANTLKIESFIIDSQLKLSNIAKFTTIPVTLHLEGSLQKTNNKTNLNLSKNSLITVKNIVFTKQQNNSTVAKKNKTLLKLKTLTTKLEGDLQLMANNALSVNLKAHSQASQVNVPKKLQINSFDLLSHIKGDIKDIDINATASANGIYLGSISLVGPTLSPKMTIVANKLLLTDLLSLNIQLPTKIELIDGLLDYSVSGQLTDMYKFENNPINVSVELTSVSGEVNGIWIQELNWQQDFTLLAGKIATLPSATENLTVALIETPTPMSKLSVNTNWTFNNSFKLSANRLTAEVLGGSFSIPKIEWPFENDHSVNVQLNSIDLEQLLALDKKQGIVVTGNISGQIPVTFDGEKYIIENGELYNINNGLIQVRDNPAVAELKANNTQLQLAFEALQNLHYHQLSSAVSMADDGYMLLETVIKGRNPDIDNDVNLNLNLSYDLLGLLESMSITQRFEESIIKGLQKNKE